MFSVLTVESEIISAVREMAVRVQHRAILAPEN